MRVISILYFSRRSIFTIDLPTVFRILFDAFPDSELRFVEMNEEYKALCSDVSELGMVAINKRLMVFEGDNRREDLEYSIIHLGQK
jgi:hypothetical protein